MIYVSIYVTVKGYLLYESRGGGGYNKPPLLFCLSVSPASVPHKTNYDRCVKIIITVQEARTKITSQLRGPKYMEKFCSTFNVLMSDNIIINGMVRLTLQTKFIIYFLTEKEFVFPCSHPGCVRFYTNKTKIQQITCYPHGKQKINKILILKQFS